MRFFVCVSQSKGYSREKTEPKSNEKTMGKRQGREDRQLFSLPFFSHPSPIFHLTSYFTKHERKTQTKPPATRAISILFPRYPML